MYSVVWWHPIQWGHCKVNCTPLCKGLQFSDVNVTSLQILPRQRRAITPTANNIPATNNVWWRLLNSSQSSRPSLMMKTGLSICLCDIPLAAQLEADSNGPKLWPLPVVWVGVWDTTKNSNSLLLRLWYYLIRILESSEINRPMKCSTAIRSCPFLLLHLRRDYEDFWQKCKIGAFIGRNIFFTVLKCDQVNFQFQMHVQGDMWHWWPWKHHHPWV